MPKNALQGLLADPRGEMRATPRNALMGLLADKLAQANAFATQEDPRYPGKRQNQTLGLLADAVSLGSIAKTADRASYGEPLTNAGKANVPLLRPETADTAMALAGLGPRNALGLLGMGAGMADNGAMRAATVWHGSPHKFDKFDASKIGTGEGAQAYGHGLYLAESPEVAGSYQQALAHKGHAAIVQNDRNNYSVLAPDGSKIADGVLLGQAHKAKAGFDAGQTGSLYKVDLPDDQIARMLDWDKPLSQQAPEVRQAFLSAYKAANSTVGGRDISKMPQRAQDAYWNRMMSGLDEKTGAQLYAELGAGGGGMPGISGRLQSNGVAGIRYLDGGSRYAGTGSSNFVVFPGNENLLKILERNGQPLK